jgi:5'-phosphate synthase pdxT subunit
LAIGLRVGVLALQGAFREHVRVLDALGVRAALVRTPDEVAQADALIIPGGESTTIGKLMARRGLDEAIRQHVSQGKPLMGTCAGLIVMAREIEGEVVPGLKTMDVCVRRNAFGRQVDSFEADLEVAGLGGGPFRGVFIRAPWIATVGEGAQALAAFDGKIVAARQGSQLGLAFHPELTEDPRFHQFFLSLG